MLHSLATAVHDAVKKETGISARIEGDKKDGWLVIDYGDIVVHLFSPDQRNYYDLEGLWSTGKVLLRLE
jgi:ribosome-associated protein